MYITDEKQSKLLMFLSIKSIKTLLLHKYADINSVLYTHRASLVYRYLHFSWMCNIPKNCLPVCFNLIFKEFKIYLSVGEE